jgi:hypothetical protein
MSGILRKFDESERSDTAFLNIPMHVDGVDDVRRGWEPAKNNRETREQRGR